MKYSQTFFKKQIKLRLLFVGAVLFCASAFLCSLLFGSTKLDFSSLFEGVYKKYSCTFDCPVRSPA